MIRVRVRVRVRRAVHVRAGGRVGWRLGGGPGAVRRAGLALGASARALGASAGLRSPASCTRGGDRAAPFLLSSEN